MDELNCKHCGSRVEAKYCSTCGQRYIKTPYSREIVVFIFAQAVDFGLNYFNTMWTMLTRPKIVISTFLSGDTKRYYSPLRYLLTSVVLIVFGDLISSYYQYGRFYQSQGSVTMESVIYIILGCFGLYSIVANKLLWRSFTWIEHFIISLYLIIQLTLIIAIFMIGLKPVIDDPTGIAFLGMLLFYIYFNLSVFDNRWLLNILKTILIIIGAYFFLMLVSQFVDWNELIMGGNYDENWQLIPPQ